MKERWQEKRLGDIVSLTSGDSPTDFILSNKGQYPFVKVEDLNNCGKYQSLSRSYTDDKRRGLVPVGSIMFPKRGAAIMNNKVRVAGKPLYMDSNMMAISVQEDMLDNEFLYYFITKERLYRIADTSTIPQINNKHINPYKIFLPPLAEQKKIAEILGCWDLGIEKLDALITSKKKLKKAMSQQLLTGKKRFKGFEGQEWKEYRLGDIFKQRNESGCDHLPLLAITGADGIADRDGMERRDTSSADKSKYLRICPDDLGYNTMRMWQGVNGISKLEGIISPAYTVCIPDKKRVFPQFIGYLFKSHPVIFLFYRHSQGLVSDTWNLKFSHFSKINVTIPSVEEQKKIASILNAADKEIEILSKNLEALKNQKKGLMQKLLTGQIRVSCQ